MPNRSISTPAYRFGYQGQESDSEISGAESYLAFTYRVHDVRLGRFLSVDPLAPKYPHNSPYAFSENRLLDGIELEGLEYKNSTGQSIGPVTQEYAEANNLLPEDGFEYLIDQNPVESLPNLLTPNLTPVYRYTMPEVVIYETKSGYRPGSFDDWNYHNGTNYESRIEASRSWQANPGEIPGESKFDRIMRIAAYGSMEARRDYASGGMNVYSGWGRVAIAKTAQSAWKLPPVQRGFEIERALGGNLPKAFPTVDKIAHGIVTSIKSIDLRAITYQIPSKLASVINGYINKLSPFQGASWDGAVIRSSDIHARVLNIAIPKGAATAEQLSVMSKCVENAASKNITLIFTPVK